MLFQMPFQSCSSVCTLRYIQLRRTVGLISAVSSSKTAIREKFLARMYARLSVHACLKPWMS